MAIGNPVIEIMDLFRFGHADLRMFRQDMSEPGGSGFCCADPDKIDFKRWVQGWIGFRKTMILTLDRLSASRVRPLRGREGFPLFFLRVSPGAREVKALRAFRRFLFKVQHPLGKRG